MKRNSYNAQQVEHGTGNVFADLGLPNPEEHAIKAQLMLEINAEIARRSLSQTRAAAIVGLTQPELSRIAKGRGSGFSLERLINALKALGRHASLHFESIVTEPATELTADRMNPDASAENDLSSDPPVIQACLDHATDLLASARLLHRSEHYNVAFHLATLALEEIGRREMLLLEFVAKSHGSEPSWPLRDMENHVHKLFWAFFGAAFGRQVLTGKAIQEMQTLARAIHESRLAGLYINVKDNGFSIPRDAIDKQELENLLGLVSARIGMAESLSLRSKIPDEDLKLNEWFLSIVNNETWRPFIFSSVSMQKMAESGSGRDWLLWLRSQYDEAEARSTAILNEEALRSQHLPLDASAKKWKVRVRFVSDSHAISSKALKSWNSRIEIIKLLPVSGQRNQLFADFYFYDNFPLQSLWYAGWTLSRKFAVALNMGSRGFWWWHLPRDISRFYVRIDDLERNHELPIERQPRLKIDWGQQLILTEQDLELTARCFAALPNPNEQNDLVAFNSYIGGLTFMSLNDIHWQCEIQAYANFHECLKAMARDADDWDGKAPYEEALITVLSRRFETADRGSFERFVVLARAIERQTAINADITLGDVGAMKVLCDSYFLNVRCPQILMRKAQSTNS